MSLVEALRGHLQGSGSGPRAGCFVVVSIIVFLAASLGWSAAALARSSDTLGADITSTSGIIFVHAAHRVDNNQRFQETTMGGACWGDYDQDGRMDLFIPDSLARDGSGRNALYRNLGVDGATGHVAFEDVATTSGLVRPGMAQGCAWGDYDADGWPDLFVTYGMLADVPVGSALFRNLGEGRGFEDVTEDAGVGGDAQDPDAEEACLAQAEGADGRSVNLCFTVAAAWLDYDLDGDLDLYVGNYVNTPEGACKDDTYPNPILCTGQPNRLFRNDADGTFTEIGAVANVDENGEATKGRSLGIVTTDIDGDTWPDIYVGNDFDGNAMYLNQNGGIFRQASFAAGTDGVGPKLYTGPGHRAGMGVEATDLDNDGRVDLLSTHLKLQYDAIYLAAHQGMDLRWNEVAENSSALLDVAFTVSRWGGGFFDWDLDGWKDYLVVSGHQYTEEPGPVSLLLNNDAELVTQEAPAWAFGNDSVDAYRNYRGAAFADVDDDGDWDVFLTALESAEGPGIPRLIMNTVRAPDQEDASGPNWLRVMLEGTQSAAEAIGGHVIVRTDDGRELHDWRRSGGSFANDHDPRLLFGIGDATSGTVHVVWPGAGAGVEDGPYAFSVGEDGGAVVGLIEPDWRAPSTVELLPPLSPEKDGVRLAWQGTLVPDFASYNVYVGQGEPSRGGSLAGADVHSFSDRAVHSAIVPTQGAGDYWFRITVEDRGGQESEPSGIVRFQWSGADSPMGGAMILIALGALLFMAGRQRRGPTPKAA